MSRPTPSLEYKVHLELQEESVDPQSEDGGLDQSRVIYCDRDHLGSVGTSYYKTVLVVSMENFSYLAVCTTSHHSRGKLSKSKYSTAHTEMAPKSSEIRVV